MPGTLDLYDHSIERESFPCSLPKPQQGSRSIPTPQEASIFPTRSKEIVSPDEHPDFIRLNRWGSYTLTIFKESACAPSREACI